ncbi:MAG TPA: hypothetical protein PKC24_05810 [Cyclobacteriaceae bacterium]|nr:hypothetical protein [Cyclobacteriaceae bacterium]
MNAKHTFFILISVLLISCSGGKDKYKPETHLNLKEQDQVMRSIIRYVAKLPRRTADSLRMLDKYDDHYELQLSKHRLFRYYIDKNGEHFFLITRRAPSIYEKYVAVGGRMRYDKNGVIIEYEEVFRTWKLFENEINERAPYLFDLMIKGEDLTPYYTATAGFNYIEFPDDNVYYDKEVRAWRSKTYGSVEEMVYER